MSQSPSALPNRNSNTRLGSPMERDHVHTKPNTIGFIGAPLVDGQNLVGADLAPLAFRKAGIQRLVEKLHLGFVDHGDMDFAKKYQEKGLAPNMARPSTGETFDQWNEWMNSGAHENFTAWRTAKYPGQETDDMSPKTRNDFFAENNIDPYERIVNAHLMGPAIELVYDKCLEVVKKGHFLLTVGGDHSIATGTIAAVTQKYDNLSVIWIDAHADANTPSTSPSLHYHGMPAGHVLGWFDRHPKGFEWMPKDRCVNEMNFAYIGLRDIDPEEGRMLRNSDLHIYTMREVDKYGVAKCIEMALDKIDPNKNRPLHLSLDVDGIDPQFAPGTGTCARGGLSYREIHYICEEMALTNRLVSMDVVEINPGLDPKPEVTGLHGDDPDLKPTTTTVQLGVEIVLSALGKTILGNDNLVMTGL